MLESDYMKKLGSSIRFYRTKANLTQGELASQIGKSLASVSKYERGDCAIDCYTLSEIASALGLRIIQLLPGESSPARQPDSAPAQSAAETEEMPATDMPQTEALPYNCGQ